MIFEQHELNKKEVYKLLSGSVVPRPIAWVSTVDKQGTQNLAPFSFFTVASWNPPTLCFSVGPGASETRTTLKDTLVNIIETGEFVINIVSFPLANQMHESSMNFLPKVDEFDAVGVTPADSNIVRAPRVLESPINMECKLDRIIEVGTNHLVLGRLVCYHIKDDVYIENYKVNTEKLQPIGRLGGNYALINDFFELTKP
ncbi:flavin reductase family protein [Metabacillus arenae]|uniref:Flavin reductase family protein n=1 Tax=Metabacillus arenae TaxID=2771434 RepID=A0A926NJ57_9BACI|nr:flavin reductase family protein [Metabacillus arenae]MBD1382316.1 flavin reductase family protein [Metabacillus arenae]